MITDGLTPFNLLALFAVMAGSGLDAAALGAALIARRYELVRLFAVCLGGVWLVYGGAFLVASLTSKDVVLARGEEKHLCEVDCHLAYSVVAARRTPMIGTGAARMAAEGVFEVVTVRVRFDAGTISAQRGMSPLWPDRHWIDVVDGSGREYSYSLAAQRILGEGNEPPLSRPLVPGESYTAQLAFDVPPDARELRLSIRSMAPPTWFVIGHENSFLHGKTTFRLTT